MVLVVASVEEDSVGEDEEAGEEEEEHFHPLPPPVHKVPVEHIGVLRRRQSVLKHQVHTDK